MRYITIERHADNGELSHHEILDFQTGEVLFVVEDIDSLRRDLAAAKAEVAERDRKIGGLRGALDRVANVCPHPAEPTGCDYMEAWAIAKKALGVGKEGEG